MLRVAPSCRRNLVRGRQTRVVDAAGRRVTKNDQRFVYNGYLQVANYHLSSTNYHLFVWDPTEPVATRPLVWRRSALGTPHAALFYAHDGNKNVSEVIAADGSLAAHYEYAPFGALTVSRGTSAATNPWRFSSEYAEDDTATVYYNYRHYEPVMGRWLGRDPIREEGGLNIYAFCCNKISVDIHGLGGICDWGDMCSDVFPAPPGGWAAEAERQRLERERRQKTESALPSLSLGLGVAGTRNIPVGGGWGISVSVDISWEFGTCCDKENNQKNIRKMIGKVTAGAYGGFRPPIEPPAMKPPEIQIGYLGPCPEPGESYIGLLSFGFSAGGVNAGCSYSYSVKDREWKWECSVGFVLAKIARISVDAEGGISYEKITIF